MFEGGVRNLGWPYRHAFVLFFLLIEMTSLLCNTRCPLPMPHGVLRMDHPFNCGVKRNRICEVLKLPQRRPNPIPFCFIWDNDATKSIEKEIFINGRLSKYVEFWRMGMCKDETYARKLGPYMDYWKNILDYIIVKTFANSKFNLLGRFLAFKQLKI